MRKCYESQTLQGFLHRPKFIELVKSTEYTSRHESLGSSLPVTNIENLKSTGCLFCSRSSWSLWNTVVWAVPLSILDWISKHCHRHELTRPSLAFQPRHLSFSSLSLSVADCSLWSCLSPDSFPSPLSCSSALFCFSLNLILDGFSLPKPWK